MLRVRYLRSKVTPARYGPNMDGTDASQHYAQAFGTSPGQCFRMVSSSIAGARGAPHRCPLPVAKQGDFKDSKGRIYHVEACLDHAGDLAWCEDAGE